MGDEPQSFDVEDDPDNKDQCGNKYSGNIFVIAILKDKIETYLRHIELL